MTVTQTIWTPTIGIAARIPMRAEVARPAAVPEPPASETLMTVKDVADVCKLSETAVRRAVAAGELSAVKLRSRLRITREAFDDWILAQRQPVARPAAAPRALRSPAHRAARRAPAPGSFRAQIDPGANHLGGVR
jgi:excisionase family DNA binding protein